MSIATGITLPYKIKNILVGEKFKILPVLTPETATDKSYDVTSDNPTVAGYTNNDYIQGFKPGTAVIRAIIKTGAPAMCLVRVWDEFPEYDEPE